MLFSLRTPVLLGLIVALWAPLGGCSATETHPGEEGGGATGGTGGTSSCGAEELCDGIDNDCDDLIDEDCQCSEGETQACYTGEPALEGIGVCQPGEQICDLNGAWGPCEGSGEPSQEVCDGADNDCDAQTDEDLEPVTCGLGACQITVEACADGEPVPCIPGTPSPVEACDGIDDDCDGTVDNGCSCTNGSTQPCYTGSPQTQHVGECSDGLQTCANGAWGACVGDVTPVDEECDGLDNDCDTFIDEDDPQEGDPCPTGLDGICSAGTWICNSPDLECIQNLQPAAEVCNGLDDDCDAGTPDGSADPQIGMPCDGADADLCPEGQTFCSSSGTIGCNDPNDVDLDLCNGVNDSLTEDCNPATLDGTHEPGLNAPCDGTDVDLCQEGIMACQGGPGLVCNDPNDVDLDLCDGVNSSSTEDCNPATADGAGDPGVGVACDGADADQCLEGFTICGSGGSLQCSDTTGDSIDVCGNGLDEDCDGTPDDGCGCEICGDGCCGSSESYCTCPGDCSIACGDGCCSAGESYCSCPADCSPSCGDGCCSAGESYCTCPADCSIACGDGCCSAGEVCTCAADCGDHCGDGTCSCGETSASCPADCAPACSLPQTIGTWEGVSDGWTYSPNWLVSSTYMRFDDEPRKFNYTVDLVSPAINLSGCTSALLAYSVTLDDWIYDSFSDLVERLYVQCSGDGATWYTLTYYEDGEDDDTWGTNDSFGWTAQSQLLHAACLTATARVRFRADGDDSYAIDYWGVDNVSVQ